MLSNESPPYVLIRFVLALLGIGVLTFSCYHWLSVNATTSALLYVVALVLISRHLGFIEAIFASLAAGVCFNYFFLPPVFTFHIGNAQDCVAYGAFFLAAFITTGLATRAKHGEQDALASQSAYKGLYALSRSLLLGEGQARTIQRVTDEIADVFGFRAVALLDGASGKIFESGPERLPLVGPELEEAARFGMHVYDPKLRATLVAIKFQGKLSGALAIRGGLLHDCVLDEISELIGTSVQRAKDVEARAGNE
jgi:two-component system, OmpR family, sensor histidine kinase KdpD